MKLSQLGLLLIMCMFVLFGCESAGTEIENVHEANFGKTLTIAISEKETVDAQYLKLVLDGKAKGESRSFVLWDKQELEKMADYMDKNNLMLSAGEYTFNQAWKFDNGYLISNNNEKHEVFRFEQIEN